MFTNSRVPFAAFYKWFSQKKKYKYSKDFILKVNV